MLTENHDPSDNDYRLDDDFHQFSGRLMFYVIRYINLSNANNFLYAEHQELQSDDCLSDGPLMDISIKNQFCAQC